MAQPAKMTEAEALEAIRRDPTAALTLDIDDETILKLQKMLNPYARIVGPARTKRHVESVMMSITNLREDYIRRFTVTALTGFVFRMLGEYTVPVEQRRWTPGKPKGDTAPFTVEDLEARAEALAAAVAIAKDARAHADAAAAAAAAYNDAELVFTEEDMKGALAAATAAQQSGTAEEVADGKATVIYQKITEYQRLQQAAKEAEGKAAGALFVSTVQLRDIGIDADLRLPATEKAARKHPGARAVIDENKGWERGLLPAGQFEVPQTLAQGIIRDFLRNYFEYDPDAHVRSAYDEVAVQVKRRDVAGLPDKVLYDPYDPSRLPLAVLLENAPPQSTYESDVAPFQTILSSKSEDERQRDYNTLCRLLTNERVAGVARYLLTADAADPDRAERWRRMLLPDLGKDFVQHVPPQDTFHRFKYYCDVNYEALRTAVEALYHDKPDLEFAMQLMKYFEGPEDKVLEEAQRYRDEHQHNVITDMKLVDMGGWTFLGEFDKNREKIDVQNDRAKLLKRILDRMDEDAKYGQLLMRQRVYKEKAKNIAEEGPDDPGLSTYKSGTAAVGEAGIKPEDKLRLERAKGDLKAARELKYFDEQEALAKSLEACAQLRALTADEKYQLGKAYENMAQAREMMEVPANAIQTDIFRVDAKAGTMVKEKMYTRAAGPHDKFEDESLTQANRDRDAMVLEIAKSLKAREADPLSFYPPASRGLAEQAFASGLSAPPLAPFAQDYLASTALAADGAPADAAPEDGAPDNMAPAAAHA